MSSNWEWQEALAALKEVEAWTLEHLSLVVCTAVVVVLSTLLLLCLRRRNKGEHWSALTLPRVLHAIHCHRMWCSQSYVVVGDAILQLHVHVPS